jgi:hypothetical protein
LPQQLRHLAWRGRGGWGILHVSLAPRIDAISPSARIAVKT